MPLRLVGTRSRAIRRRTSKEGANEKQDKGKSLSSESLKKLFPCAGRIASLNHMPVVPLRSLPEESSQFRHLTTLATTPCFLPLVSASLFVGLGNAVGGSYLTLFVIDKAHLSPLALGVFLTVYSLSGMIISTSFGRWFDRTPSPIPLLLALVMTISGSRC